MENRVHIRSLYRDLSASMEYLRKNPGKVRSSRNVVEKALEDGHMY